ncbi:MAG TPA: hypothetical protein VL125_04485 [Pelobium sp.]|nr:hypothetical protein [Pelobium sp.]
MKNLDQQTINLSKDILYLIGSILGIIGFIRTFKKRDYCVLNYRTDFGNEVEPYLICLKSDMYNLKVSNTERAVIVSKYPSSILPTYDGRLDLPKKLLVEASFFPLFKESEFLVLDNRNFKIGKLIFTYEDKYENKYKQEFSFDESEIGNHDRIKRTNRSCYILTKRRSRFLYMWFPLFNKPS